MRSPPTPVRTPHGGFVGLGEGHVWNEKGQPAAEPAVSRSVGSRSPPALTYSTVSKYGSRGTTVTDPSCPAARPAGSGVSPQSRRRPEHREPHTEAQRRPERSIQPHKGEGWFRFTHFPWTQCRLWRLACGRDPGARGRLMHGSRVHLEYTSHRVRPKHPAKHESYVLGRPYRRPAAYVHSGVAVWGTMRHMPAPAAYVHSGVDPPFTPTPFTPAPRLDRARPPPLPSSIIRSIIWSMVSTAQVRIHRYHSQGRSLDDWAAA